jgi:hypothetical protein
MMKMMRAVGAAGLRGEQAQRASLGLAEGARNAIKSGGPLSALMYQAAGMTGKPGGVSFDEAQMRLEADPVKYMMMALQSMGDRFSKVPINQRARMMETMAAQSGIQLTLTEAKQIMEGAGGFAPESEEATKRPGAVADRFLARRMGKAAGIRGDLAFEAQHQLTEAQLGGGAGVRGMVQTVRHADIEMMKASLPHVAGIINDGVHLIETILKGIPKAIADAYNEMENKLIGILKDVNEEYDIADVPDIEGARKRNRRSRIRKTGTGEIPGAPLKSGTPLKVDLGGNKPLIVASQALDEAGKAQLRASRALQQQADYERNYMEFTEDEVSGGN